MTRREWCGIAIAGASFSGPRIAGAVRLSVKVGTDGTVREVAVLGGIPLLYASAEQTVRNWRFAPGLVKGKAAAMTTPVTISIRAWGATSRLEQQILPDYPEGAPAGVVQVRAAVGPDGRVNAPEAFAGPDILRRVSLDAVRQWRFTSSALKTRPMQAGIVFQNALGRQIYRVGSAIPGAPPFPLPEDGDMLPRPSAVISE